MGLFLEDLGCYRHGIFDQGFWALQIHRFGSARRKFKSPLIRKPWGLIHFLLTKVSEAFFGIGIGMTVVLGRRIIFEHFGYIVIHSEVVIGDDVIIRQGVTIGNRYLDRPLEAPTIGSNVNIGAGAALLGKIVIGNNVDIGANAVVLCNVPSDHIAVGVPARISPRKRKDNSSVENFGPLKEKSLEETLS